MEALITDMTPPRNRPHGLDGSGAAAPSGSGDGLPAATPVKRKRSKRPRPYHRHGMSALKLAVRELGGRTIDRRTTLGRALVAWKDEHVEALGGETVVTPQQRTILDVAAITKLLHDSFSAWLVEEAVKGTLINKRRRSLAPAVQQRQVLGDALARYMIALGLERSAKPGRTFEEIAAELAAEDDEAAIEQQAPETREGDARRSDASPTTEVAPDADGEPEMRS